jgi:hypothetical protein
VSAPVLQVRVPRGTLVRIEGPLELFLERRQPGVLMLTLVEPSFNGCRANTRS